MMETATLDAAHSAPDGAAGRVASRGHGEGLDLKVRVVSDIASIMALEPAWRRLEAAAAATANAFQGFDWCMSWIEAGERCREPVAARVVVVESEGRAVLLWPLAIRRLLGCRVVHWLGEPMTQYGDVLIDPSCDSLRSLEAAYREIRSWKVDAFEFRRVRADSCVAQLPVFAPASASIQDGAPFIDLAAARRPDGTVQLRSSRTRNSLKRKLQKLGAAGDVGFDIDVPPSERHQLLEEAFRLKAAWLHAKGMASSGLSHPATYAFMHRLNEKGGLIASRMTIGDSTAAIELGFTKDGRYYSFLQSYAERYAASGPGQILFWKLAEHFALSGLAVFDFLAPAYPHKREWASGEVSVSDYVLPNTPVGRLAAFYLSSIRPSLKEADHLIPLRLRQIAFPLKPARSP